MRSFVPLLAACCAILSTLHGAILASPHVIHQKDSRAPTVSTLYQFSSNGSWVENLAVRSNGELLVTRADVPELWSVSPSKGSASLVYSFPNANGLLGITEICPDVFAVVAGVLSLSTATATPGSFVIWKVDLKHRKPIVTLTKAIPEALFLNGVTTFDAKLGIVLIADSVKGAIWRLNTKTGAYSIALSDPTMLPAPGQPIGVNGVKVFNRHVYYTSSTQGRFCRVAVDAQASSTGPVEIIAGGFFQDDFTFSHDGTAYITTNVENTVLKVTPQGQLSVVAGSANSSVVAGATACQFGRTQKEEGVLYVTTSGAQAAPVNGTFIEPGKVVAVHLSD
ncbi:hypothetical protein B0J12DRAFT_778574 [Macrophomina phaseolina]|uniref:Six-bladed beta-propeller TolB-like protein n=1 Tax=Macrophomina phaseolina TaxID=35725 RepID=A0ABQ8FT70_9PEZI|nr:hypothetical protein B0J12DRAFT_778574 [Macrophomina phaseolina]